MDGSDRNLADSAASSPAAAPPIRFVREDEPVEDAFAHRDLARAVSDSLAANSDLRVVGILGRWGSGKSTVVDMAEAQCRRRGIRFFKYDAWLHQSDAPRRAFLEELMRFVKSEGADLSSVENDWDFLVGRKERVETSSTPGVPIWAGFVLALGLATPLALNFVRPEWGRWHELGWLIVGEGRIGLPFVWGALVALTPFVLLMAASIYGAGRWLLGRRGPHAGVVSIFANRMSEVRTDVKIRQADPTTLEFQRFLRQILLARAGKSKDRLVMVVDNLDRLPDQEMISLWGTIRGLFHGTPSGSDAQVALPTVLLPIDAGAILRLHGDDEDVAIGFEEKTFDIVFRVPTPVHSDWKRYLTKRLLEVFGPEVEAPDVVQFQWAAQAVRILEEGGLNARTPRSLNAFANQVAVLWLQWRERNISFAAMCFYAAHVRELELDAVKVLQADRPWMATFDPAWASGVAALRFGARPEVAMQILLKPPLQEALAASDQEAFERLSHIEGFPRILREVCDEIAYAQTRSLTPSIRFLNMLDPSIELDLGLAWRSLIRGWIRSPEGAPLDEERLGALTILLRQSDPAERNQLISTTPGKLQTVREEDLAPALPWFARGLGACGIDTPVNIVAPRAQLPGGLTGVLALCDSAVEEVHLARFEAALAPAALGAALAEQVANGNLPLGRFEAHLPVLRAWPGAIDWAALVGGLGESLYGSRTPFASLVGLALTRLLVEEARRPISAILGSPEFDGFMKGALPGLFGASEVSKGVLAHALALRLAEGLSLPPASDLEEAVSTDGDLPGDVARALIAFAPEFGVRDLARCAADSSALCAPVFTILLETRPSDLDPADVAAHPLQYVRLAGRGHPLWVQAANAPQFWSVLNEAEDISATLTALNEVVVAEASPASQDQAETFAQLLLTSRRLSQKMWREALLRGGAVVDSYLRFAASPMVSRIENLEAALRDLAAKLADPPDLEFVDRWFTITDHQTEDVRQALHIAAAGELLIAEGATPLATLQRGWPDLLNSGEFDRFSDHFITAVLLPAIRDPAAIQWLGDNQSAIARLVGKATDEARRRLVGALISRHMQGGLSNEQERIIRRFAELTSPDEQD